MSSKTSDPSDIQPQITAQVPPGTSAIAETSWSVPQSVGERVGANPGTNPGAPSQPIVSVPAPIASYQPVAVQPVAFQPVSVQPAHPGLVPTHPVQPFQPSQPLQPLAPGTLTYGSGSGSYQPVPAHPSGPVASVAPSGPPYQPSRPTDPVASYQPMQSVQSVQSVAPVASYQSMKQAPSGTCKPPYQPSQVLTPPYDTMYSDLEPSVNPHPPSFKTSVSVYDSDENIVGSYTDVIIPVHPHWKNDMDCLHYLSQQCPAIRFNGVYGVTPYYHKLPLYALQGSIYPRIAPPFRHADGWDLKLTQQWSDINSSARLSRIEKNLTTQTSLLNDLKVIQEKPKLALVGEFANYREMDLKTASNRDFEALKHKGKHVEVDKLLYKKGYHQKPGHLPKGIKYLTEMDNYVKINGKYIHKDDLAVDFDDEGVSRDLKYSSSHDFDSSSRDFTGSRYVSGSRHFPGDPFCENDQVLRDVFSRDHKRITRDQEHLARDYKQLLRDREILSRDKFAAKYGLLDRDGDYGYGHGGHGYSRDLGARDSFVRRSRYADSSPCGDIVIRSRL